MAIFDQVRRAWNAFRNADRPETYDYSPEYGAVVSYGEYSSSGRPRPFLGGDRTIITSIYNRISIDVAGVSYRHIKTDKNGRYDDSMNSNLNTCLTLEPNMDQGPRAFRQDVVMTLFSKGCAVIVPVDTTLDPTTNERIDIYTLRVGEVVKWHPKHVKVSLYNEDTGKRQEVTLEKRFVAIVENPLYAVMNAPNSTLQRLIRKLEQLDAIDEQSASGKLDLIIQLPYTIKTEPSKLLKLRQP